ncbi:MAG: hypothetical protein ACLQNG_12860 [Acidimicrobiales bacterium]
MKRPWGAGSFLRIGALLALIASTVVLGVGPADAAGPTSHTISGLQNEVSCLTASRCVLVGANTHNVGDIVDIDNGVQSHAYAIAGSPQIYAVSCPSSAGCVALGENNSVQPLLISISASGKPSKPAHPKVAVGVELARIACVSLSSCVVFGIQTVTSPQEIVVGTWSKGKLTLSHVDAPKGTDLLDMGGVSCVGTTCEAAGYALDGIKTTGLLLTISHGKPGKLRTVANDLVSGVSCTSTTRCYVAGNVNAQGRILTLDKGVVSATAKTTPELAAIACGGSSCTAVGEENAPAGAPPNVFVYGAIVAAASGDVTSVAGIEASSRFYSVAHIAGGYVALGDAQGVVAAEVTIG